MGGRKKRRKKRNFGDAKTKEQRRPHPIHFCALGNFAIERTVDGNQSVELSNRFIDSSMFMATDVKVLKRPKEKNSVKLGKPIPKGPTTTNRHSRQSPPGQKKKLGKTR